MIILMLGPQGSGKGTQARLLSQNFDLVYFEAGEFLRDLAKTNDNVRKILDNGELVDEKELSSYVTAFFDEKGIWENIIFDGFPRTTVQYEFLKNWLNEKQIKIDLVLVINVSEETTIKRLLLRKRDDDTRRVIRERLQVYVSKTLLLIKKLKEDSKVVEVDGEGSVEEIQSEIVKIIENIKK